MYSNLSVEGRVYNVVYDENGLPQRVSRLKNNITPYGHLLFAGWLIKHCNYYVTGADTSSILSGLISGYWFAGGTNYYALVYPQISGLAFRKNNDPAAGVMSAWGSNFSLGLYKTLDGFGASYSTAELYTILSGFEQYTASSTSLIGYMAVTTVSQDDPSSSGVAHIKITSINPVTLIVKGFYSFESSVDVIALSVLCTAKAVTNSGYLFQPNSSSLFYFEIFRRAYSYTFNSGQSVRVTWSVTVSGT